MIEKIENGSLEFKEVQDQIIKNLESKQKLKEWNIDEECTLLCQFGSFPLDSILGNLQEPSHEFPIVLLMGKKTGRIYPMSLQSLLYN